MSALDIESALAGGVDIAQATAKVAAAVDITSLTEALLRDGITGTPFVLVGDANDDRKGAGSQRMADSQKDGNSTLTSLRTLRWV